MNLQQLNTLSEVEATTEFLKCCGSHKWAQRLVQSRPFESIERLCATAADIWWDCDRDEWLEAFRSHPKIGGKKAEANASGQSLAWSAQEQSGIQNATERTLDELAQLNREYEGKFGHIFIVCATGKSSAEMLGILESRLGNDEHTELRIAAGEQAKITELRLKKLVD
jgi:OHCU decarboxylase